MTDDNDKDKGRPALQVNKPQPGPDDWKKADDAISKLAKEQFGANIEITGWDSDDEAQDRKSALDAIKSANLDLRYINDDEDDAKGDK